MATRKAGLGKGLDSLIPASTGTAAKKKTSTTTEVAEGNPTLVKITKVEPNREQPRKKFDEEALNELAESIKQFGVLQPLLVQDRDEYYEIIAGERRWRAAKLAGLKEVPVIIKKYTNQEIVEISLIENIQRENLNPIEEAIAYKRLLEEFNLKQEEVATRVSKSRTAVTNAMRLLKLDERVQKLLVDEAISSGHARALLAIENSDEQYQIAQDVVLKKYSVRDIEKIVKKDQKEKEEKQKDITLQLIFQEMENKLKEALGTKVAINDKGGKGKIEIEYYSTEEFENLVDMLKVVGNNLKKD